MKRAISPTLVGFLSILLLLTACSLPVAQAPTPTLFDFSTPAGFATNTAEANTATPTRELPTVAPPTSIAPTSEPPTAAPPTQAATQAPTTALQQSERISMAAGGTAAVVEDSVSAGGRKTYLVGASGGQFMMVNLASAAQTLSLEIKAPGGTLLIASSENSAYWQGALPSSGDYRVSVVSSNGSANFSLSITIPARITFDQGAISATLDGKISGHLNNTYLLRALKGQTMTVTVTAPGKDIFLTIYGLQDGNPYVRSVSGQTQASIKLPSTQDYVIQLVPSVSAESYTVKFVVQ